MTTPQNTAKTRPLFGSQEFRAAHAGAARVRKPKAIAVPVVGTDGHYASPSGLSVQSRKRLTTERMTRILRAVGLTPSQHAVWVGWSLKQFIEANPTWTERQWFDLLCENRQYIINPPAVAS